MTELEKLHEFKDQMDLLTSTGGQLITKLRVYAELFYRMAIEAHKKLDMLERENK